MLRARIGIASLVGLCLVVSAQLGSAQDAPDLRPKLFILQGSGDILCSYEGQAPFPANARMVDEVKQLVEPMNRVRFVPDSALPDSMRGVASMRRMLALHLSREQRLQEICDAAGADAVLEITWLNCQAGPMRGEGTRSINGGIRLHYVFYSTAARRIVGADSVYEAVVSTMFKPHINFLAIAAHDTASQQYGSEMEMYTSAVAKTKKDLVKDVSQRIDELVPVGGRVLELSSEKEILVGVGSAAGVRKGMKFRVWPVTEAGTEPDNMWVTPETDPVAELEITNVASESATAKVKKVQKGRAITVGDVIRFKTRKS